MSSLIYLNKVNNSSFFLFSSLDHQQCNVYKEELCKQERRSTLDQEELEPLQVKQEQEEPEDHQIKKEQEDLEHQQLKVEEKDVYCSQDGEQVELKQETDTCMLVPVDEQTSHTESEPNRNQVIFQEAAEAENQNQERRRPFSCETCGKRFTAIYTLNHHIRTHTGEKPFSCVNCGKSFSLKQLLTRHKMIHTGEKPFSCVNCGKSFSLKQDLTKHMM
ncbi:gastrula zinc finger protein XlCGF26.1-like, partial [Poecilia latipinna]